MQYISGSIRVASIVDTTRENILRWFGHVLRREETEAVRLVKEMYIDGKRGEEDRKRGGGCDGK